VRTSLSPEGAATAKTKPAVTDLVAALASGVHSAARTAAE